MAALALTYNLILLAGTAYLVDQRDWNPWWFLIPFLFVASYNSKTKDKQESK